MAITPLTASTLADKISQHFSPKVVSIVNSQAKLFSALTKTPKQGAAIYFDVAGTGVTVESFDETTAFANASSTAFNKATVGWAKSHAAFSISDHAMDVVSGGSPEELAVGLAFDAMKRATKDLFGQATNGLNAQLFIGSGAANKITGLDTVIDPDNVVYGIDQAVVTAFAGNVVAGGAAALTMAKLDEGFEVAAKRSGYIPDLIVASPRDWGYIKTLVTKGVSLPVAQSELQNGIKIGAQSLFLNGALVMMDKDCPDGTIYGLNTADVYIAYLPPMPSPFGSQTSVIQGISEDGTETIPLRLNLLARTGANQTYSVEATCALVVENPGACFKLNNFIAPV